MTGPSGDDRERSAGLRAVGSAVGLAGQRLDKWLWCARVMKSRTQATALVVAGKVRVNRVKTDKPSLTLKIGDVITVSVGPRVRVLSVTGFSERRGSATVAQTLFQDLTPPVHLSSPGAAGSTDSGSGGARTVDRDPGSGRPTKKDRRQTDRLRSRAWDDS